MTTPDRAHHEQWRRACTESLLRSQERRHAVPSSPWPARGYRLEALLIAALLIAFGYVLLIAFAAALSP